METPFLVIASFFSFSFFPFRLSFPKFHRSDIESPVSRSRSCQSSHCGCRLAARLSFAPASVLHRHCRLSPVWHFCLSFSFLFLSNNPSFALPSHRSLSCARIDWPRLLHTTVASLSNAYARPTSSLFHAISLHHLHWIIKCSILSTIRQLRFDSMSVACV